MPSSAETSVKLGVTVKPPCTALSSVTVKVMSPPSSALALLMVTVALSVLFEASSLMVPVPVSVDVTPEGASETLRPTVKVSLVSTTASCVVETVKVLVSLAVPSNESADVFSS